MALKQRGADANYDMLRIQALQEQLQFLQNFLDGLTVPAFCYDKAQVFRFCNHAFENIIKKSRKEIVGASLYQVFSPELADYHIQLDENSPRNIGERSYDWNLSLTDTANRVVTFHESWIFNDNGECIGIAGVLTENYQCPSMEGKNLLEPGDQIHGMGLDSRDMDACKLMKIESELIRLDQLRIVGEMAASLGHEIRNPMTTVRGFLQMMSEKEESAPFREYFELMLEELDRANTIISEYLSVARGQGAHFSPQNLNTIVEALYPLIMAEAVQSGCRVALSLSDIPITQADSNEIRQLLLNLVRNGLESMDNHGLLTIGTMMKNHKVVLWVKDQGGGINPAILNDLGQPFFTTKASGTGLGLAVCYRIAVRHHAEIEIDTSPQGTTFLVSFVPGFGPE